MPRRDNDRIGRLFAQLTGQLEDACQLAVEGQNRKLSLTARSHLTTRLRRRLARVVGTLDLTDVAIAQAKSGEQL
jgi:hypothetical protein